MFEKVKAALEKSWLKRETTECNTASLAITKKAIHASGLFESRTHLLDVASEHAALALAVSRKDPEVSKVITVASGPFLVSPIVMKVLGDHARRTGVPIEYQVLDIRGKVIYELNDVYRYYAPPADVLPQIKGWSFQHNDVEFNSKKDARVQLREAALKGMETHFSAGTNSRYGAAVRAGNKIYFGGVYSSYDHRMNLHAEMVAAIAAIADNNRAIEEVAIISNKFVDEVPHMCGCCRQFFAEIEEKTGKSISVVAFSFDGEKTFEVNLGDYLPSSWSSGKRLDERK